MSRSNELAAVCSKGHVACEAGLLEIAVNAALNPIIIINNFGEVVYWNAAAESTFGYSREEAIGQDVHILIAPKRYHEQVKRGVEIFRECESGEVANKVQELQAVRKNGQEFPIELSLSSIKSSEGRWSVGVVRDITEQRKAKEDLVKKEMFIRRLLNEIDKPIFYENSDGVIVLCNIAFANMVGLSVDDVVGRLLSDIAPACFANFNNAAVFKIIENGEAHSSEMCLETADKGLRDIVLHTSLMCGDSNHEFGIVGIVIDVTEEKKMMLKILDSERTESIGYLAGGIGHDFNNYLMGMAGNAGLMQILHNSPKKPEDRLSENQLKYLKRVLEVSERAGNLVKQLLSLGRKDFVIEPISMNLTVQQAYTVLRTIDKGTEINICSHGDDYISGDSLEIQRLIVNLGVNAIHAMESSEIKKLCISTGPVAVKTDEKELPAGNYVLLKVSDTGCGMTEEVKSKMFDPFFTTKKEKGSGLGLSLAYKAVKVHNGFIFVETSLGRGTTFKIYFPKCGSPKVEVGGDDAPATIRGGKGRVLVIDDEDFIRSLLSELLDHFGCQSIVAKNGKEGLDIYRERWKEIDLVILDMQMPEMSGAATFRQLIAINPEVKVILASGDGNEEGVQNMLEAGVQCFISKPYHAKEMIRMVYKLIGNG